MTGKCPFSSGYGINFRGKSVAWTLSDIYGARNWKLNKILPGAYGNQIILSLRMIWLNSLSSLEITFSNLKL
jgi:hypothetical protein